MKTLEEVKEKYDELKPQLDDIEERLLKISFIESYIRWHEAEVVKLMYAPDPYLKGYVSALDEYLTNADIRTNARDKYNEKLEIFRRDSPFNHRPTEVMLIAIIECLAWIMELEVDEPLLAERRIKIENILSSSPIHEHIYGHTRDDFLKGNVKDVLNRLKLKDGSI